MPYLGLVVAGLVEEENMVGCGEVREELGMMLGFCWVVGEGEGREEGQVAISKRPARGGGGESERYIYIYILYIYIYCEGEEGTYRGGLRRCDFRLFPDLFGMVNGTMCTRQAIYRHACV